MIRSLNAWLVSHRGGIIELAVWAGFYGIFVLIMALGDSNAIGMFSQADGHSLWAPLTLGGAVNFWIIYLHAYKAMPYLQQPGQRPRYLAAVLILLAVYLAAHLSYQLAIAWTFEASLKSVTLVDWTLENLVAAPVIFILSAIYKFGRDWIVHSGEREALLQRTTALEDELRLMKEEFHSSQQTRENQFLKFQSNRESVQTPVNAIKFVKAAGNYVEIVTRGRTFTVYGAIKDLAEQLPPDRFVRVHRSFIVNLNYVETIGGRLITIDGASVPIGASYKKQLMSKWSAEPDQKHSPA